MLKTLIYSQASNYRAPYIKNPKAAEKERTVKSQMIHPKKCISKQIIQQSTKENMYSPGKKKIYTHLKKRAEQLELQLSSG
mgnify:CR=1 FL=1